MSHLSEHGLRDREAHGSEPVPAPSLISEDQYSNISAQLNDDDTPDNTTIASYEDQDDYLQMSQHSTGSRKRKRDIADQAARNTFADQEHRLYADELLDYFMMGGTDDPNLLLPDPPKSFIVNKPIDDFGYTALHWAAAMGDVDVCKDLINRGASPAARSDRHETPLIRAVMFTNNFEKQTMPKLINLLKDTIEMADACGSNVFHHITATTSSRNKNLSARYYLDTIINKLSESVSSEELSRVLDARDSEGDTALHIAARNGSKKCVRSLIGHNASSNIPNHRGELAEHLIATISARPKERFLGPSSSPFHHPMRNEIDEVAVQGLSLSNGASQSAFSMTQTIVPLILEKTESFNEACANELKEKEEALAEGQRSFRALSNQLQETVRAVYDLATVEHDEAANRNDRDQVSMLVAENESLLEQVQCQEVPKSCLLEESKLSPTQLQQSLQPDQKELWAKVESARYLAKLQQERRALIKDAVQRMSMTGADERQALYRKLLSKTMNVPEDEVPSMVPDIMSWLKDDGGDDIMNEMPMLMGH